MRVMIFAPLYHYYGRSLEAILEQRMPSCCTGADIVMGVDARPPTDAYDAVTTKYVRAQETFLAGKYDALLTIEDDIIAPRDALARLLETEGDVCYALYVSRRSHKWLAYTEIVGEDGRSLSDDPELARRTWGSVIEVQGVGLGCTLIRRHVLESISFRRSGQGCCDWYLAQDCIERGFRQVCDTGLLAGHIEVCRGTPFVLWPDPNSSSMLRREELPTGRSRQDTG